MTFTRPKDWDFRSGKEEGRRYVLGPGVRRAPRTRRYDRQPGDPLTRPLHVFTLDPSVSQLEGATTTVRIPYEPLEVGQADDGPYFQGTLFRIMSRDVLDDADRVMMPALDLDAPRSLIGGGLSPSPTNYRFHQQMVYAVASSIYDRFRTALGRDLAWGFDPVDPGAARLRIDPHCARTANAYYSRDDRSLTFGYIDLANQPHKRLWPGARVFTCLSHDVIAHELTHALLDGLRANFHEPTNPDVGAFHEALADLVAILQKFSYHEVLERQIEKGHGAIESSTLLFNIATELGFVFGSDSGIRSAIDSPDNPRVYDPTLKAHELGSVLVSAVFDAFTTVYRRKTDRFLRLATNGSGVLPQGYLSGALTQVLAEQAAKLASQFLSLLIRALDYCPPVDLTFGEYLRAVITADRDLIPDDKWGYREALIDAFTRRHIFPADVKTLSEEALAWQAPRHGIGSVYDLSFAVLAFDGEPSRPASETELLRQARTLGDFITRDENLDIFGLTKPGVVTGGEAAGRYDPVEIESIRTARRVGPDGRVVFDLVAEVMQRRHVDIGNGMTFPFLGGTTVLIDPHGRVRHTVLKRPSHDKRLATAIEFARTSRFWEPATVDGVRRLMPAGDLFRALHAD